MIAVDSNSQQSITVPDQKTTSPPLIATLQQIENLNNPLPTIAVSLPTTKTPPIMTFATEKSEIQHTGSQH